jgi:hypothetical protein
MQARGADCPCAAGGTTLSNDGNVSFRKSEAMAGARRLGNTLDTLTWRQNDILKDLGREKEWDGMGRRLAGIGRVSDRNPETIMDSGLLLFATTNCHGSEILSRDYPDFVKMDCLSRTTIQL